LACGQAPPTARVADAAYGSGQHSRTVGRQGKGASSRSIPLRSATLMPVAKMLTGDHNAESERLRTVLVYAGDRAQIVQFWLTLGVRQRRHAGFLGHVPGSGP